MSKKINKGEIESFVQFEMRKTDQEVYYFNFISWPDQVITKKICDYCSEEIIYFDGIGSECPYCDEIQNVGPTEAADFFDTDQEDDSLAGFALNFHKIIQNDSQKKATISIQGFINVDLGKGRFVNYNDDGTGNLSDEINLKDYGIKLYSPSDTDFSNALRRIHLFSEEWVIRWKTSGIFDKNLKQIK
jgi:hypothetical protein